MAGEASVACEPAEDAALDEQSAQWVRSLRDDGTERHAALARLHAILLPIARRELRRRSVSRHVSAPDIDDLAHQATADAMLSITAKINTFRGDSRFTTWAYKFVILEVSAKLGRHFARGVGSVLDEEDWDRLPDRFGVRPADAAEVHDFVDALHRAVDEELTERQRQVFVALVLDGTLPDALAVELGTNRNALYKTMFDARRKLRIALAAKGYLDGTEATRS